MAWLSSDGSRYLGRRERAVLRLFSSLRKRLQVRVRVDDRGRAATYVCETAMDAQRPLSLWVKEEGTMAWIDAEVRADDVFMDIGANIGIYSIAAALRTSGSGIVYAFEPHKVNSLALLRNVGANGLQDRVRVFSCGLSDRDGLFEFNYQALASASSASQLGHRRVPGSEAEFVPVATEMIYGTSVDRLVEAGTIRPPTLVKIDVDGNELPILRGMSRLLAGAARPRAVQVELNVGEQDSISAFLQEHGYALASRHFTHEGKNALARGDAVEAIAHNAIFVPA
ncbi:MAG TPA: FkbM family methyltransferase [Caldimonas sp.]|jgi:FkbM family methyltransferase|nr:FkbM family methyltransferase [Caldimonas sp.]HEX2542313.1 FkbM family methyltransferase [Caldimonas sp.]